MLRSAALLGRHSRLSYRMNGLTFGRSLSSTSNGSHLQPDNKVVVESLIDHPYHDLLLKVSNMSRERSKLREVASLMDTVPIESLIQTVANQIKSSSMMAESYGDHANPLLTVVDALIYVKSSDKLRSLVDYLRHDAVMAHQIGARRILLACEAVVDADYMNSDSIQKGGNAALSFSENSSTSDSMNNIGTARSINISNPSSTHHNNQLQSRVADTINPSPPHRLNRQHMIEQELTKSFVPLLCSMPPHVRCHHITGWSGQFTYSHTRDSHILSLMLRNPLLMILNPPFP